MFITNNNIHFNLTIAGSNTGPDNKELIKLIKNMRSSNTAICLVR